ARRTAQVQTGGHARLLRSSGRVTDPIFQERLAVRERRAPVPWVVAAGTVLAMFLVGVFVKTHGPMIAALMAGAAFALAASFYFAINWSIQKRRKDTPLVRA